MSPAATEKSGTLAQRTTTELQSNGSRMGGLGSFLDCENTFRPDRITEMCERFSEFAVPLLAPACTAGCSRPQV